MSNNLDPDQAWRFIVPDLGQTVCQGYQQTALVDKEIISFCLFDLVLYIHNKQLRSCWDGQLLNHTVNGQASGRQLTST